MRSWIHNLVTIFLVVPLLFASIFLFAKSIDLKNLDETLLVLGMDQIHYLLLMTVCLILLFELIDQTLNKISQQNLLIYPATKKGLLAHLVRVVWWIFTIILLLVGFIIPFLDILGSIPFSISGNISNLAPKITLILLTSIYIYHLLERGSTQIKLLKSTIRHSGHLAVLTREEDHNFMSNTLDTISHGSQIYVTHFEEPQNPMQVEHDYGFYYENDFMKKWYEIIRKKSLKVSQIILVNSDQDIEDLEKRIQIIKDIPNFSLAYLFAPPLTIFVDFMVVPGEFALIGFSDDLGMRNMDIFSLLIRWGPAVSRFEHLFSDVLLPEARFVKTFEGVKEQELEFIRERAKKVARSSSTTLKGLFNFSNQTIVKGEKK